MRKTIKLALFVIIVPILISSCTDEDKFKNPVFYRLERGGLVRFTDIFTDYLLAGETPQEAVFSEEIYDPNGNLSSFEMNLVTATDTLLVQTVTSFPAQFTITGADIELLTGETVSFGDSFTFYNVAVRNDGVRFTPDELVADFENNEFAGNTQPNLTSQPGYADALSFDLIIACPGIFDPTFAVSGTYTILADNFFGQAGDPLEVIAGPDANQITLVNLFADGFNVVVTFNDDGTATVPKQDAWVSGTYGQASVEGGGPVYDCADLIILDLEHTVAAGSFGVGTISFQLI